MKKKLVTLKKNKEFSFVYHKGKALSSSSLTMIYFMNRYGGLRFGYSVSKKVGNAVTRNRIRRQLKECTREILKNNDLHVNANIIYVAKNSIVNKSFMDIKSDFTALLNKAGIV